jgi:hypothetical protein
VLVPKAVASMVSVLPRWAKLGMFAIMRSQIKSDLPFAKFRVLKVVRMQFSPLAQRVWRN